MIVQTGKARRAAQKRLERLQKDLDRPYTTTKRAFMQLATDEANKLYEEKKKELATEITGNIMFGITKTVSFMMSTALEEAFGFKAKRNAKAIMHLMKYLEELQNPLVRVKFEDHEKYWNEQGLRITEQEDGNMVVEAR